MQSNVFPPPFLKEGWGGFKNQNTSKISCAKSGRLGLESDIQH
jgi:hypothetical protein